MDTNLIEQQITGLKGKLEELRGQEKLLVRASGIDEEAAKIRVEMDGLKNKTDVLKEEIEGLVGQKNTAVSATARALSETMSQILPVGSAVFRVDEDGNAFIGWKNGHVVPYDGLSGGERVMFDAALCHALRANVIIQEAAELDGEALLNNLAKTANSETQFIASTCHAPGEVSTKWKVISMGEAK